MADRRSFGKKLSHAIEGGAGWLCYGFFPALPLDWASALGGWLARSIGPHVGASKRARINLRRAMPDLPEAEVERVIRGMWDNLGRVAAEFPHIGRFKIGAPDGRITVERFTEIIDGRKPDTRFIFFSGHYGNWEIATYVVTQSGRDVIEVYRAANNPSIGPTPNPAPGVIEKTFWGSVPGPAAGALIGVPGGAAISTPICGARGWPFRMVWLP